MGTTKFLVLVADNLATASERDTFKERRKAAFVWNTGCPFLASVSINMNVYLHTYVCIHHLHTKLIRVYTYTEKYK